MSMEKEKTFSISFFVFLISLFLILYMPLHVFIAQSASLVTGGLELWKAAKDVFVVLLVPLLLYIAYRRRLFHGGEYKPLFFIGVGYLLLHLLFILFDGDDDTYSAIVASVYNGRLLIYLLIGMIVGSSIAGKRYAKYAMTTVVLIACAVALFGVAQYFLPKDLLTNVGYSIERGVKPMFFIDDKPDLPRVMSTLRDPNSLGAFLILPTIAVLYALWKPAVNKKLFARPFQQGTLVAMAGLLLVAQWFTFSRGAALGLMIAIVTLLYIVTGQRLLSFIKLSKNVLLVAVAIVVVLSGLFFAFKDSYFVQNVVFHADDSTVLADPNELRVSLTQDAVEAIADNPFGYGPGSAGLVAISNPKGGILTENYYLQIFHEVGLFGIACFVAILYLVVRKLYALRRTEPMAVILCAVFAAYAFYSLLIHLWSNEAIALQWWLLAGIVIGLKVQYNLERTRISNVK